VISAVALVVLALPASAGAVTLIGSGSVAAQPVLQALFSTYTKQVNHKVHFVYTANGGNAGVKDVQNGTSQFAGNARTPLPSDAGTTYVKMFLDGLCMDVNPKNKLTSITIQQTHDIYRGLLTNWSQIPGSGLDTTIDPVGRDTNGGTYNFFLQAVSTTSCRVQRQRADLRRPRPNAVNRTERDRLRGLAWQGAPLKVNGNPRQEQDQRRTAKYPLSRYLFLSFQLGRQPGALLVHRLMRPGREVILKAGGVPAFTGSPRRSRMDRESPE
jgi:ABC-type phosphate transport system substrate-binding protein